MSILFGSYFNFFAIIQESRLVLSDPTSTVSVS